MSETKKTNYATFYVGSCSGMIFCIISDAIIELCDIFCIYGAVGIALSLVTYFVIIRIGKSAAKLIDDLTDQFSDGGE